MGLIRTLTICSALIGMPVVLIISLPGLPPHIELKEFFIKPPSKLGGWFASNTILDEAELYFEQAGVESLAILSDDVIITGNQHGALVKVVRKHVFENLTNFRFPCTTSPFPDKRQDDKELCGWPLGMRLDKKGNLWSMDYFGGLVKVDLETGNYENVIPKSRHIQEKIGQVPEDLDIASDGTIFWSDGSTVGDFFMEMVANPSGRLIKYNPNTRANEVLLENLHFSNGVCLSDDESFVLVAESGSSKITRYHISGPLKGQSDTFLDGLPGYPDNIRSNGRGGFYIPIIVPWNTEFSMKIHLLSTKPLLRKFILRSSMIILSAIDLMRGVLPDNIYLDLIQQSISQYEFILNTHSAPRTAQIIEVSSAGEIIGVLNAKQGKVTYLSQISVGNKYGFMVSPFVGKIWRIKLDVLRRMH